jgi:SAM-dependent methyltransferase
MTTTSTNDRWASGDAYEGYIGRWSRKVAPEFLAWLQPPAGLGWLDAGCGTGALTQAILDLASPASITGIDTSAAFLDVARSRIDDERAAFQVGDAQAIPLDDQSVDIAVSALCLNHVPDPERAAAEMTRVTRLGGTVAAYVWDYAGEMWMSRLFWEAAERVDPAAASHEMGMGRLDCAPGPLHDLFAGAGLQAVQVTGIVIDTPFASFDDYWRPYEGGTGVAPNYAQSLPLATRAALRGDLRRTLPAAPDGSILLTARAWAARGRR